MNINATLIGQMITFGIFVWFTVRYVWPPLVKALAERQAKIAEGLTAAEQSKKALEDAREQAQRMVHQARVETQAILQQASDHAARLMEQARERALEKEQHLVAAAKLEIDQSISQAKVALRKECSELVLRVAEKIVQRSVTPDINKAYIEQLFEDSTRG